MCGLAKEGAGTCSEFLWLPGGHHTLTPTNRLALSIFATLRPGHEALEDPPVPGSPRLAPRDSGTLTTRSSKVTHSHVGQHYRCNYNSMVNYATWGTLRGKKWLAMSAGW